MPSQTFDGVLRSVKGGEIAPAYYLHGPAELLKEELVRGGGWTRCSVVRAAFATRCSPRLTLTTSTSGSGLKRPIVFEGRFERKGL
jgi:hypothetical protein